MWIQCLLWNTVRLKWEISYKVQDQFSSAQSLSRVQLFATPWTAAHQASLSIINSRISLRLRFIESVMPSNISSSVIPFSSHLQSFPTSVFSNESVLRIRWPKYWSFSFSISPSKEHLGPISFRMDWLDLLAAVSNSLRSFRLWSTRLLCSWDFSGKNTRVGCHFPLQRIFPTQGSNPHLLCLLHCRQILYPLRHLGTKQYIMHFNLKIGMFNCRVRSLNYYQAWLKMVFKFAKTYRSNCPALKNSIILLYISRFLFFVFVFKLIFPSSF